MTTPVLPAPRFNHVAMSVSADLLDEENRASLTKFYSEVFGFEEHAMLTVDRKRLVLGAAPPRPVSVHHRQRRSDDLSAPGSLGHVGGERGTARHLPRSGQEVP